MRARLHLISAPWSMPHLPSIQLASLKAYIDSTLGTSVQTFSYSAFLSIPYLLKETMCLEYYDKIRKFREQPYKLLYQKRFVPKSFRRPANRALADSLDELEQATIAYIEDSVVPNLSATSPNVIGFTLNYNQTYASAFFAKHLQDRHHKLCQYFLFGGYGAVAPETVHALAKMSIEAYRVVGEGEEKLRLFMKGVAEGTISGGDEPVPGVVSLARTKQVDVSDDRHYESQLKDLSQLPLPDYDEYFELTKRLTKQDPILGNLIKPAILLEGTRGCFAHCDFCGLNLQWRGFRKQAADVVSERFDAAVARYRPREVRFVDNVCDTWAAAFAEKQRQKGQKVSIFMELRAHHPEPFWYNLATAGVDKIQIGVEALSASLLKKIGKGTTVIQNLAAMKYMKEAGITSISNIITHHPKSTLEDVEETKRVLEMIPHFEPLHVAQFWLSHGSPLANEISGGLCVAENDVEEGLPLPESLKLSAELQAAWDSFSTWYRSEFHAKQLKNPVFQSRTLEDGTCLIIDSRSGLIKEHKLDAAGSQLFSILHRPLRIEAIRELTGLEPQTLLGRLEHFINQELIIEVDGYYLTPSIRIERDTT